MKWNSAGGKSGAGSTVNTLPGRAEAMVVADRHTVNGNGILPPFPDGMERALFALGCFWGAERLFWSIPGVFTTAVGYTAGATPNPTYEEVCSERTAHAEAVLVVFDPVLTNYGELLKVFWEGHNPTQGMRQGNDVGTQYRSGIYFDNDQQRVLAEKSLADYEGAIQTAGYAPITTEILAATEFFYAEDYHQQYLAKNPSGYCGLGGTGVKA
jgi:peptide-methionine (S)-S-oxide reductase